MIPIPEADQETAIVRGDGYIELRHYGYLNNNFICQI